MWKIMETVFEHNPTSEELDYLFEDIASTKEELLTYGLTQVQHYTFIYYLYKYRNDKKKAKEYLDKIPDTFHKWNSICFDDLASGFK